MRRVCVNCGSSPGFHDVYRKAARDLGADLVRNNIELVYGGADVGLMGEIANAVLAAGGTALGVIPQALADKVSHAGLTELRIVGSMHERKQMMHDLSDAFIALPGGFGTIEEITELLTWAQLGIHKKPVGLLNIAGYYDSFLSFLDHAVSQGFMKKEHRAMLLVGERAADLLERFQAYAPPTTEKWVTVQSAKGQDGEECRNKGSR